MYEIILCVIMELESLFTYYNGNIKKQEEIQLLLVYMYDRLELFKFKLKDECKK